MNCLGIMSSKIELSIIVPSLNRAYQLEASLKELRHTVIDLPVEILPILDRSDYLAQRVLERNQFSFIETPDNMTAIEKWNIGSKLAKGDWLMIGADDCIWQENWYDAFSYPNYGFLAFLDGNERVINQEWGPHYAATRDWLKAHQNSTLCVPHYKSWGIDLEIAARAKRSNTLVIAKTKVRQNHYLFGTAKMDSTAEKGKLNWRSDLELYKKRESEGFPNDWERVLFID